MTLVDASTTISPTNYTPSIDSTLRKLKEDIKKSKVNKGSFFLYARESSWSQEDVHTFGPEYLFVTRQFPKMLAKLAARTADDELLALLTDILHSELGGENYEQSHWKLFQRLLKSAGVQVDLDNTRPHEETQRLLSCLGTLYSRAPYLTSLGAQFALEHQAIDMLEGMRAGFIKLKLPSESLRFFTVHLTPLVAEPSVEERHMRLMESAIARAIWEDKRAPEVKIAEIRQGANKLLDGFDRFWTAVAARMGAVRSGVKL